MSASSTKRRAGRTDESGRSEETGHDGVERDDDDEGQATNLGVVLRRRRSLTNVGGAVETSGDETAAKILTHAIDVTPSSEEESEDRAHVHGFHAYPARAHPVTARRLIEGLTDPKDTVLDPFCGSGTVLVEAMLLDRQTIGTDLNPIAVMLARAKTFPRSPEKTAELTLAARKVAEHADARRKAKSGASRRLPREDVAIFAPHVLLELDGIREGIEEAPAAIRPDLMLVLSSILVKLSQRRGDTSAEAVEKRIGAGYPARLFVKKTQELARRFDEFRTLLPSPPPRARVFEDDATILKKVDEASIDAVITSPPYVATYDYLAHHELRMRWLGLDARKLARGEMGARRNYEHLTPRDAIASWDNELAKLFRSLARVMKRGAPLVLLIADSAAGQGRSRGAPAEPIRADEAVARVAERGEKGRALFTPIARASQARPHFHGPTAGAFSNRIGPQGEKQRPRYEHALLLERA